MTVQELIAILQRLPGEMEIYFADVGGFYSPDPISIDDIFIIDRPEDPTRRGTKGLMIGDDSQESIKLEDWLKGQGIPRFQMGDTFTVKYSSCYPSDSYKPMVMRIEKINGNMVFCRSTEERRITCEWTIAELNQLMASQGLFKESSE